MNHNTGRHTAPTTKRTGWRRRLFGVPVAWWLLAGTAAAAVAFSILLGVTGSLSAGDGIDVRYDTTELPPGASVKAGSPTCTAQAVSETVVQYQATNVKPGDACQFAVITTNVGPATAHLNGFALDSPDFAGGEVTATVNNCGLQLPGNGAVTEWAAVTVTFGDIDPGQTFTFDAALDGYDWRTSAPVGGSCT